MQLSENSQGHAEVKSSNSAKAQGDYSDISNKIVVEEEENKDAFDVRQEINAQFIKNENGQLYSKRSYKNQNEAAANARPEIEEEQQIDGGDNQQ